MRGFTNKVMLLVSKPSLVQMLGPKHSTLAVHNESHQSHHLSFWLRAEETERVPCKIPSFNLRHKQLKPKKQNRSFPIIQDKKTTTKKTHLVCHHAAQFGLMSVFLDVSRRINTLSSAYFSRWL